MGPITVTVLYFARGREVAGTPADRMDLPEGSTTTDVLNKMLSNHPGLSEVTGSCVLAHNREYLAKDAGSPVKDGDEIALIPPISGG